MGTGDTRTLSKTGSDGIRILNVCETAKGGIATYLNLLWKIRAPDQAWRFIVQDTHRSQLATDMPVQTFPASRKRVRNSLKLLATARKEARAFHPDIIFFHSTFTLPAMAALRLMRVKAKFVYCAHGWAANRYPSSSLKHHVVKFFEKHLVRFCDVVVNISGNDLRFAQQAGYKGAHIVIENAVEDLPDGAQEARQTRGDRINLLFVGRFDRQKGLDILLKSFNNAVEERPDLSLSVIGDAVLADLPPDFENPANVRFHGWIDNDRIAQHYANADLLVVPSRWEGFGLIVAEAMRSGTPAMVSDRGNLPDIVEAGKTGYVVPLSVPALTQALLSLDKAQLSDMRPVCRKVFETRFHQDRFGAELQVLFKELSDKS